MLKQILILTCAISLFSCGTNQVPNPDLSVAQKMIQRLLPNHYQQFTVNIVASDDSLDVFEIEMAGDKVKVTGSSIPALGSAINYYLKNYCHCQISRTGTNLNLPDKLPVVEKKIHIRSPYKYRYYLNYCTFNYSMSWWGWKEWEHELDWMALHGVNLSLAIIGHEKVWQETLRKFNVSEDEILKFIPGPSYTAWWLMGNLQGWGGPVDQAWIDSRVELQKKILKRMTELGIQPVLQNFYGFVPDVMREKFPNNDIRFGGIWAGKEGFQRPATLVPTDPLFSKMAAVYYEEQKKLYGAWKFYGGDPFHEGGEKKGIDITASAKAIESSLIKAYPEATWVLQGWWENPTDELLAGTSKDKILILDLFCESTPQWRARNGFDGRNWVWCALLNFGSKVGMFGKLDTCSIEPIRALNSKFGKNMKGIGMIIEGNETNPVNFDLIYDMAWRHESPDMHEWLKNYTHYRYGAINDSAVKAWNILRKTAYNCNTNQCGTSESFICARPKLVIDRVFEWGQTKIYYVPSELEYAGKLLASCNSEFKNCDTYQYDLVDVTRQALSNRTQKIHQELITAFNQKDKKIFESKATELLNIMYDEDTLLATRKEFMLGTWLEAAKRLGTSGFEKDMNECNARTMITVWGTQGVSKDLHDYSCREWSGMISDFYIPRWKMFIDDLRDKLNNKPTKEIDWYAFESSWVLKRNLFPDIPKGNSVDIALHLQQKYKIGN